MSQADQVIAELDEAMEGLVAMLEAEIRLVRAGKRSQADRLRPEKTRLADRYAAAMRRLRAEAASLRRTAPDRIERLRRRHEVFCEDLQTGVTVLMTAKSIKTPQTALHSIKTL